MLAHPVGIQIDDTKFSGTVPPGGVSMEWECGVLPDKRV